MARKLIKRWLPDPEWIKAQDSVRMLGDWIHDPNIWHLNRSSVSKAVFIGLFVAFIPLPAQMVIAGFLAVLFRANLPISVVLVWITNPVTMAPIFYLAYRLGCVFLGAPEHPFVFELSWQSLIQLEEIWKPFLLGCLVCGLFCGLLGSTISRILWRWHASKRWHERRLKRQRKTNK
jgi:hypothetical protein